MFPNSWSIADDAKDGYTMAFGGSFGTCGPRCNVSGFLDVTWGFINGKWIVLQSPAYGPLSHGSKCYLWHNGTNTSMLASCPSARQGAWMGYDGADGYVLLFGGDASGTGGSCWFGQCQLLNDTWVYSNGNWTNITANQSSTPAFTNGGSTPNNSPLVNDPIDGYILLSSSCNGGANPQPCFIFSGGHWSLINITSTVWNCEGIGGLIFPWGQDGLVADLTDGYLLGGHSTTCNSLSFTTWYTYHRGAIGNVTASSVWPSVRTNFATVYDTDLHGILLFGGCDNLLVGCPISGQTQRGTLDDTWLYANSKWTELESPATRTGTNYACYLYLNGMNTSRMSPCPPPSESMSMVYDSTDHMVLLDPWSPLPGGGAVWYGYVVENLSTPVVSARVSVVGHAVTFSEVAPTGWGTLTAFRWNGLPPGCASLTSFTVNCTLSVAGTYVATVTEERSIGPIYASFTSSNVTLVVNPALSVTGRALYPVVDSGANETFHASVTGGLAPDGVTWRLGDGNSSSQENVTHAYSHSGNYTARFWVNDSLGDSVNFSVAVEVIPPLRVTLTLSSSTPLLAQTVAIDVNASEGLGPYSFTYLGLPPGCVSINKTSIGCLPTQAGAYNISAVVHDRGNATVNVTRSMIVIFDFNVVIPVSTPVGKQLTIMVNTNETFNGSAINKTALFSPAGGYGTFTYSYSGLPPGCTSADVAVLTCTPTQAGKYSVTVSVHDQAGDHQTHTVLVNIVPNTFLGLPGYDGYVLIGVILASVVIAATFLMLRKRGSTPLAVTSEDESRDGKETEKGEVDKDTGGKESSPEPEKKD